MSRMDRDEGMTIHVSPGFKDLSRDTIDRTLWCFSEISRSLGWATASDKELSDVSIGICGNVKTDAAELIIDCERTHRRLEVHVTLEGCVSWSVHGLDTRISIFDPKLDVASLLGKEDVTVASSKD